MVEPSNAELAAKLGIQPKARRDFYDLIVVGGGPAGLSTALYATREGIETLVVESSAIGGQAGVTERIDNYLGFPEGVKGARLADDMRAHAERFGAEMLPAQTIAEVRADGSYRTVITESGDEYSAMASASLRGNALSQAECARRRGLSSAQEFTSAPPATGPSTRGSRWSSSAAATAPLKKACS